MIRPRPWMPVSPALLISGLPGEGSVTSTNTSEVGRYVSRMVISWPRAAFGLRRPKYWASAGAKIGFKKPWRHVSDDRRFFARIRRQRSPLC